MGAPVQSLVSTPAARVPEVRRVTRVIDGDTIEVEVGRGVRKVRLLGIDTPETKDPRRPVECFGREAAAKMRGLVGGRAVRLERDEVSDTVDRYGRLLRYVYSGDRLVNAEMIRQGYARAYLLFPFSRRDEFREHEREARDRGAGLWAPDACGGDAAAG
jgi:micrococcal nuclease